VGIDVIVTAGSYTSWASFLDGDPLPVYDPAPPPCRCSGGGGQARAVRAADGTPLNADVNGAYNILGKAVPPGAFAQVRSECVIHPVQRAA